MKHLPTILLAIAIIVALGIAYTVATEIGQTDGKLSVSAAYCRIKGYARVEGAAPVILVPGIKGSLLNENGKRVWLSVSDLLPGRRSFALEADSKTEPQGILTRLNILPGLVEYRPYYGMAARLACAGNGYAFSYDWRRDPRENAELLGKFVAEVEKATGQRPRIVAHSMGGLVTRFFLSENPEAVSAVAYAGVPFRPGLSFLDDINQGAGVGLNNALLSKEAVYSHPSSFMLLPHSGSGAYMEADLLDARTWERFRLGAFADDGEADMGDLDKKLSAAQEFGQVIDMPTNPEVKTMAVLGDCESTWVGVDENGEWKFEPGDGRVPAGGAVPNGDPPATIHRSCVAHDVLLNDPETVEAIMEFLEEAQQ